jgi:hypothetical protein
MTTFVQAVDSGLVLTLGLESSVRYKERFTGSYYLSRSFIWGYIVPAFPQQAFVRVGHLLTPEERGRLLVPRSAAPGVKDAWWLDYSSASVASFLSAVSTTLPRIRGDATLRRHVEECAALAQHMAVVQRAERLVDRTVPLEGKKPPSQFLFAARASVHDANAPHRTDAYLRLVAKDAWLRALAKRKGWQLE